MSYWQAPLVSSSKHSLQIDEYVVNLAAHSVFPRVVGDNALIFDRQGPKSPRNAFAKVQDAYTYFNCFSTAVRKVRPEPENHSILPILTKAKLSVCPVATEIPGNFCLSISPSVTLWNPYNVTMKVSNIFAEVPFNGKGNSDDPFKCSFTQVDFKEYDLYRKWWAYIYGDFNSTFELKPGDLSTTGEQYLSGNIKNWTQPWGIYGFESGKTSDGYTKTESGLIEHFLKGSRDPQFDLSHLD